MANAATYDLGIRLIDRIKSACQLHGIDTRKACERMLAEEISRGLSKHLIPRHMIRGGLLHPQVTRPTADLDILFERRVEPHEMHRAFELMKHDLAAKGIELRTYSHDPEPLHIDGHGGDRYKVMAMAGNTRINTKIDMTGGTQQFPKFRPERRHGSVFFKGQEPLFGLYQTFESQAADKLIEVITNPSTTRWKDFRDLSILHNMKLDVTHIGAEVVHKMRQKLDSDYAIMDAFPEEPLAFKWELAQAKAQLWQTWKDKNAPQMNDFIDVLCGGRQMYNAVRQHLLAGLKLHEERRQRIRRQIATVDKVRHGFAKDDSNVINMGDYRDPATLGFRPKM
ncbi:nucleotidyl transferase AbiEii/AbiGii toxin family protein [Rhizobium laguerreae]|uniref:nucleotidyl transferase AbiEii/AbiGii toxin family protein n=1 Tax=Rhizobium laguerreae TaxID=1076926 RepID=UPI001C904B60|nr:nucleotidyl transferase AbiEii/AbiGii toxin family protein [Rhizobium laguerreae]MBY3363774.1 nucleotidyl transferase AbiEii/AbiGii toxin family protein [Rhizobium laguerreae]